MKKLLIILFATLISGSMFSQKIKIEKKTGLMSIDNVDVAKFSSSKNADKQDVYSFADLHSNDVVTLTMVKLGKDEENYLQVNSSLSDKTSEMDYELISFTLNMNSAISNLIVKKYNFFTTEGMNKEAIIRFLNLEDNRYKLAYEAKMKVQQAEQDDINVFAPFVKNILTVANKNTNEEIITMEDPTGKFNRYRDSSTDYNGFIIKDREGNLLGSVRKEKSGSISFDYFLETYDKKIYPIGKLIPSNVPMEVTKKLILNDYLGDGEKSPIYLKQLAAEAEAARVADAQAQKEEYKQRVFVTGILTLEDGKVLEGEFMAEFRETADGIVSSGNIISLDGKTLRYYFKNDKGKDAVKIYKEKEISSFKVTKADNPDYEEYYCKIEYLSGNKIKTELAYRTADMPKTTLYFSGKKIFVFDKKNDKIIELSRNGFEAQLKEIAVDCPTVAGNIEWHKYSLNRNSIYSFTSDYNKCK